MTPFKRFKDELDDLQSQGGKLDPSVEQLKEDYAKQVAEAAQLLREKQTQEREIRSQKADDL